MAASNKSRFDNFITGLFVLLNLEPFSPSRNSSSSSTSNSESLQINASGYLVFIPGIVRDEVGNPSTYAINSGLPSPTTASSSMVHNEENVINTYQLLSNFSADNGYAVDAKGTVNGFNKEMVAYKLGIDKLDKKADLWYENLEKMSKGKMFVENVMYDRKKKIFFMPRNTFQTFSDYYRKKFDVWKVNSCGKSWDEYIESDLILKVRSILDALTILALEGKMEHGNLDLGTIVVEGLHIKLYKIRGTTVGVETDIQRLVAMIQQVLDLGGSSCSNVKLVKFIKNNKKSNLNMASSKKNVTPMSTLDADNLAWLYDQPCFWTNLQKHEMMMRSHYMVTNAHITLSTLKTVDRNWRDEVVKSSYVTLNSVLKHSEDEAMKKEGVEDYDELPDGSKPYSTLYSIVIFYRNAAAHKQYSEFGRDFHKLFPHLLSELKDEIRACITRRGNSTSLFHNFNSKNLHYTRPPF